MILQTFFLITLVLGTMAEGARILAVLPSWAKSHHRFMQPVLKTLAAAGHKMVVYSPFPLPNPPPNYTDVHLESIKTESEEITQFFLKIADLPQWKCMDVILEIFEMTYRDFMGDPKIRQLLKLGEKFDLIIAETFSAQEYTLILSYFFKIPVIGLQAFFTNNIVNSHLGNDLSLPHLPDTCFSFSNTMTFRERLVNSLSSMRGLYYHYNEQLVKLEQLMRKDFPDMPPLLELTQNVSLMFVNDHLTADYAQPRTPNIIPVAGIHIEPPKPLPRDIKKFMDGAQNGVIFFSMGSYVQDELQPKKYFDMYNNVFKKLRQRVLWKTRKENIEDLPANVMTVKWAPQPDILAHPNCVLFITHGGLLSQHETIHFGVPVVGIPQFFDQHRNVRFYEQQGVGVRVDAKDVSEETMFNAVREVLENSRYRENMKRLSQIFRDRPLSPAESVVFWTEYVLRHGGAGHLRPASTRLRWYQIILLDVLIFVAFTISMFVILIFVMVKLILNVFNGSKKHVLKLKKDI